MNNIQRTIFCLLLLLPNSSLLGQMTLQKALAEVKKHHTFFFVYEPKWANLPVNASRRFSAPIHKQLEEILANTPLTFQKTNNAVYLISPRSQASLKKENTPISVRNYSYHIQVLDKDSSIALPETHIFGENFSTFSDATGDASFTSPQPIIQVQIRRLGYEATFIQLTHQRPDTIIYLTSQTNELSEVKIVSNGDVFFRSFSQIKMNEIQSIQIPIQPFGSDIFHFLRLIPGVSPVVEPTNGVYVRGASPNQTLIMYDQIQLIQPEHFLTTSGFVPSEQISSISLDKSFLPARFGGRLAALLTLESKKQKEVMNQLTLSVGVFQSRATWEQSWGKKWSVVASAQKSIPSPFLTRLGNHLVNHRTLILPDEIAQKIAFHDGTATVNFQPTPDFTMKWTYFQSADMFESKPSISPTFLFGNFIRWQSRGASWQMDKKWSPNHHVYVKTSLSVNKQMIQNQQVSLDSSWVGGSGGFAWSTGISDFSSKNQLSEIELAHRFTLPAFQLHSGIQGQFYSSEFIHTSSTIGLGNRASTIASPILYSDAKMNLTSHLMLDVGIRASMLPFSDMTILEPRLQFKAKNKNWASNLFFTQQSQALIKIALQTIPSHFSGVWTLADGKDIQVAQTQLSGLNTEVTFRQGSAMVHLYHQNQSNITEFIPKFQPSATQMFDVGKGKGWGLEIALKWHRKNVESQLDYTWNHLRFSFPLISNDQWFRAPYVPQHEWKAWNVVTWNKWALSSTFVFAIQRPNIVENVGNNLLQNINPMQYNTSSLTAYHRLDMGLNYQFSSVFMGSLSVQNVYNRKNEWYRVLEDSAIQSIYQFGIIPSFSLKYAISTKK